MTVNPDEILESRVPTSAELAKFVKALREENKWTQATFGEIARVTERTVQRIENGEPSSCDTRRALARAFQFEDLDVFEKPWPFPNVEKLKAYSAELDKTTAVVPLIRISDGRTLRTIVEGANGTATEELGEISLGARETFAAIVDYLRDYNDIRDEYSMSQRLEVDRDLDALLKKVAEECAVVGAGSRHARIRLRSDASDCAPMDWTNVFIVLAPSDALPANIRVPKAFRLA
jgi:transcriptional regulator with XRE-family HTH domain